MPTSGRLLIVPPLRTVRKDTFSLRVRLPQMGIDFPLSFIQNSVRRSAYCRLPLSYSLRWQKRSWIAMKFPSLEKAFVDRYQIPFVGKSFRGSLSNSGGSKSFRGSLSNSLRWKSFRGSLSNSLRWKSFGGSLSNSLRWKELSWIANKFLSCTKRSWTAIEIPSFVNTFVD